MAKSTKTKTATGTTSVFLKSEFWVSLVTSVAGLLLAFGVITPEQSSGVTTYIPNIIGAILSLLSSSKFVSAQHAAKVEVFRAMCAMRIDSKGDFKALGVTTPEEQVVSIARAAGL